MQIMPTWEYYSQLFILGSIIGSFLNVVIYRLPCMLHAEWQREATITLGDPNSNSTIPQQPPLTLSKPRSHCPNCQAYIPYWSNIPLIGYLLLRGRCNNCHCKISLRYPLVELVTALLFVYAGYLTQDMDIIATLAYLIFISIIICLICIDYEHLILPDNLTISLLWLGLLLNCHYHLAPSLISAVYGAAIAYLMLWLVYQGFKLLTGKDGMGFGDFKLFAALGAWFGYQALIFIIMAASLLSIAYTGILFITGKFNRNMQIPFGPFLGTAGILYLFYGSSILNWYL